jgi:hypothetical protein
MIKDSKLFSKVLRQVGRILPFYFFTFLPFNAMGAEVKSPNGIVVLNFSVVNGRPS